MKTNSNYWHGTGSFLLYQSKINELTSQLSKKICKQTSKEIVKKVLNKNDHNFPINRSKTFSSKITARKV